MMTQVGLMTGFLILVVLAALWILLVLKGEKGKRTAGDWMNALGFGLMPGIALWKAFEQYTGFRTTGRELFEPLKPVAWITENGRFAPSRIEFCAAAVTVVLVAVWLILRREKLPGNGDLLLIPVCIWSAVRSVTECLRQDAVRIGRLNGVICGAVILELICFGIWTMRRGRKEKNAGLTIPEWVAVTACGVIIVLQEADILTLNNQIANLAVTVGCGILGLTLILMTGKDSREVWISGDSDNPPSSTPYTHPVESVPPESSSPPDSPTVRLHEAPDGQKTIQFVPGKGDAPPAPHETEP